MKKLNQQDVRAITLLWSKGNDEKTIAETLKLSKSVVAKVVKKLVDQDYRLPEVFKTQTQEIREQMEGFERILTDKVNSITIGKELFDNYKKKSRVYVRNAIADSQVTFNFPEKYIAIAGSADWHLGHVGVDYDKIERDIKIIANTPNFYMMFLGDAIDNFIDADTHKEAIINADSSPKEQLYMFQYVMNMFKGKPGNKVLLAVKDNHVSHRLKRAVGVDYFNKIWETYGVFYGGEEVLSTINIGNVKYKMLTRHSYKGKSNIHLLAACKNLLRNGMYEDVDIVGLGHNHEGGIELFPYRGKMRCAIQASTYKVVDPYADRLGFIKPEVVMPTVILNPYRKDFVVVTSIAEAAEWLNRLNKTKTKKK